MDRRSFIKNSGLLAMAPFLPMNGLSALAALGNSLAPASRMPALFIGHGSPMNAIDDNEFSRSWKALGKTLPRPQAILSISAHWLTNGTSVTAMAQPKTIHDFGGFPKNLFDQQYNAPGAPELAKSTQDLITTTSVHADNTWGLDHGTWSVLLPMYPAADIPVYQLSLDYDKPASYHYELGQQLNKLRDKGVLIIGSGNLVHNLQRVDWSGGNTVYDWAQEFDTKMSGWIQTGDHKSLVNYQQILGNTATMAHPTYDHLLPLFYIMGLQQKEEQVTFFNSKFDMGSISMRSLQIA
ncbi:MAG: 4,5-DOPA dioxygenase extradiol [Taibaiella sp.]|nr:4,5-DOPA dioxygenase extradiol [Taibaiella sp.]